MIEYDRLERLKVLQKQRKQIMLEEALLLAPFRHDTQNIELLYSHFNKIIAELPANIQLDKRAAKKLFLFIILYLYSPGTLIGRKMEPGVRATLADIMGFHSPASVTYHCMGLEVWYTQYPDFKNTTDYIFQRLAETNI
ncbi:hypothetical protein [Bacteroides sp. 519]|uniref:hypothetical protein n=1 Tax=Bacteroides sp. 519 TaxID=2302937 RepID=UPI0013D789AA|nr:hypothetical protein [Bacteroides sp. 519]NDV58067.1 hypothetical protein [Bacteroides sp. 519]